jgi:hypothetical protein
MPNALIDPWLCLYYRWPVTPGHRPAAAGTGSACGLGASPTPGLLHANTAGCAPRRQWGAVVAWSSTAATTGFVRRTPGFSHDQQPTVPPRHPPQMHTYVQTVQASLLEASTTNLTGPVATPAPCGVICLLQPAWIKCSPNTMRASPPPCPLASRPHETTSQDRDQLANARPSR